MGACASRAGPRDVRAVPHFGRGDNEPIFLLCDCRIVERSQLAVRELLVDPAWDGCVAARRVWSRCSAGS